MRRDRMLPAVDETHLRRASSFGYVADDYARARPGYPLAAVRWVLAARPAGGCSTWRRAPAS